MLAWPLHKKRFFFDARPLWALAAHVLALMVVVAQPVASFAWLGGAHATLEQYALHQTAVEHGEFHHHSSAPGHHEHGASEGGGSKTDVRFSGATLGQEVAYAAPYAGSFQDLLQTLLQATLTVPPRALSPDGPPRSAPIAEDVPSQHSPPVPHRPPIVFLPTLAIP
jgi:hypothetical protein